MNQQLKTDWRNLLYYNPVSVEFKIMINQNFGYCFGNTFVKIFLYFKHENTENLTPLLYFYIFYLVLLLNYNSETYHSLDFDLVFPIAK